MKAKRQLFGAFVVTGMLCFSFASAHAADVIQVSGADQWNATDPSSPGSPSYIDDRVLIQALSDVQHAVTLESASHCPGVIFSNSVKAAFQQNQDHPIRAQIGEGFTRFGEAPDDTWYQKPFPHKLTMTSGNLSIGAIADAGHITPNTSVQIRAGVQDLGVVSSSAQATASDPNYFTTCKYNRSTCWPMSYWYGHGSVVQGYLAVDIERKVAGVPLIFEVGEGMYRPTWHMNIAQWRATETGAPIGVSVSHDPRLQSDGFFGVGVRLSKHLTLMLDTEETPAKGDLDPALYEGKNYDLELREDF